MPQFDFGNLGSPTSGSAFVNDNLEPWRDALHSGHMGPTRPSYVKAGMSWIDNSDPGLWALKLFTGSTDIIKEYADTVNNVIIPAENVDAGQVAYDNSESGLAAENLQVAIDELQAEKASKAQGDKADTALQPGDAIKLTLAPSAVASGTAIDFTDIPSNVKRITVLLNGVSLSGTSHFLIQLGTSEGLDATGTYHSSSARTAGTSITNTGGVGQNGFLIQNGAAANTYSGTLILSLLDHTSNTWVASGMLSGSNGETSIGNGGKALSGPLTSVRITNVAGANTFDAGVVSISYEV